jgi:hypothetical protein
MERKWVARTMCPGERKTNREKATLTDLTLEALVNVDRRGSTVEVGSKTNDEETKVFAIAKILYYKIIRAAVLFWKHDKIFPRFLAERDESFYIHSIDPLDRKGMNHSIDSLDSIDSFVKFQTNWYNTNSYM